MSDDQKTKAPPMKPVRMSRFGLDASSRIYGRERARKMFHQRRVDLSGEILAVPSADHREPE